jgi:hypothetical protein
MLLILEMQIRIQMISNLALIYDISQKENDAENIIDPVKGETSLGSGALSNDISSSNVIASKTIFGNEDVNSETVYTSIMSSHISDTTGMTTQEPAVITVVEKDLSQLNQKNILASLLLMEKAIVSNNYEKKLISYRDLVDAEAMEGKRLLYLSQQAKNAEDNGDDNSDQEEYPEQNATGMDYIIYIIDQVDVLENTNFAHSLQLLWCYRCELTRGREVMSMAFNKANEVFMSS